MENQKLVLASNNAKKAKEIRELLPDWEILSLAEIGFQEEIDEPWETFEENAAHKANIIHQFCGMPVIADDSGMCVDALGGAPGIYSARYSGIPTDDARNNEKLLSEMRQIPDRSAKFVCVIALAGSSPETKLFRGEISGTIASEISGNSGFGYDPLFIPDGESQTFAELPPSYKKEQSHRSKALKQLREYLTTPGKH